jgi:HEAT repeat protein
LYRAVDSGDLGELGLLAKAAIPDLLRALEKDKEANVRSEAARAVGAMGTAAKEAIPALSDPDGFVKVMARSALAHVDPRP